MSVISDIDRDLHNYTLDADTSMIDLWISLNKRRLLKPYNLPLSRVCFGCLLFSDAFSSAVFQFTGRSVLNLCFDGNLFPVGVNVEVSVSSEPWLQS